jgi:hypothetical protein
LHHTHEAIWQLSPELHIGGGITVAAITVVDENRPKPEPTREIVCLLVASAEFVLLGKICIVEFCAVTAGMAYENADERNATDLLWPTDTQIVYSAKKIISN